MNPFFLTPHERLADWKKLRAAVKDMPEAKALAAVASYWAQAPVSKHPVYDPEDPSEWPGPWEMVSAGDWCACSIAIGMEFTLRLAGWDASRLTLLYIRDYDISDQFMILKIDTNRCLNYSHNIVSDYPSSDHVVMASWTFNGRFYRPTGD